MQELIKEKVRLKEREHVGERAMYQQSLANVLQNQTEMFSTEKRGDSDRAEIKCLHRMDTNSFRIFEGKLHPTVLRTSGDTVFGRNDSQDLASELVRFLYALPDKLKNSLRSVVLAVYTVHVELINFRKDYIT